MKKVAKMEEEKIQCIYLSLEDSEIARKLSREDSVLTHLGESIRGDRFLATIIRLYYTKRRLLSHKRLWDFLAKYTEGKVAVNGWSLDANSRIAVIKSR